jgi:hypothetical protein
VLGACGGSHGATSGNHSATALAKTQIAPVTASPTTAPPTTAPPTYNLTINVAMLDGGSISADGSIHIPPTGSPCTASSVHLAIQVGTQITVSDGSGNILGTGALQEGKTATFAQDPQQMFLCVLPATVTDLPQASFYSIAVTSGGSPVSDSFRQLQADNWHITLS